MNEETSEWFKSISSPVTGRVVSMSYLRVSRYLRLGEQCGKFQSSLVATEVGPR